MDHTALGGLVEVGGHLGESRPGLVELAGGESGAEFFLTRLERVDDAGVAGIAFGGLTAAFSGRFDVGHEKLKLGVVPEEGFEPPTKGL